MTKIHNIGIQRNQKELTKTFMIFSNWHNPLILWNAVTSLGENKAMVSPHKFIRA